MDAVGAFLGPVLAFVLLGVVGTAFDAIFVVSFCIAAIGLVVLVLYVRDHREPLAGRQPVSLRSGFRLLDGREFRRLCLAAALLGLAAVSDTFVYLVLQHRLNVSAGLFPLLALGTTGVYLLLAFPLGRLADRAGRWPVFLAGHLCLLGVYLLLAGPASGLLLAAAALALHGAFYAATDGVLMAYAGPMLPARLRASGLAVVQTVQAAARFVSSALFGAAWSVWGPQQALTGFAIALVVALAASVVLLPAGRVRTAASGEPR
jgi:MFS family permease